MAPPVKTYDPELVILTFGVFIISGFAPGSMVKAERNKDAYGLTIGGHGDAARFKSPDRSGRITISLMQSSGSNAELTSLAQLDENGNPLSGVAGLLEQVPIIGGVLGAIASTPVTGVAPLLLKDLNGSPLWAAEEAWVLKAPSASWEAAATPREWILETPNLSYFEGGY